MPPFCQAMAKKPYTLFQKFRRVINANLKHEREVYTSGRVTDETNLKIREERINVMEWVKDWLDRINNVLPSALIPSDVILFIFLFLISTFYLCSASVIG